MLIPGTQIESQKACFICFALSQTFLALAMVDHGKLFARVRSSLNCLITAEFI